MRKKDADEKGEILILPFSPALFETPKPASYGGNKNKMRKLPFCNFLIFSGEGGIGYYADKSASLNAFPYCSPQGPLQTLTRQEGDKSPHLFSTPLSPSKLVSRV